MRGRESLSRTLNYKRESEISEFYYSNIYQQNTIRLLSFLCITKHNKNFRFVIESSHRLFLPSINIIKFGNDI